MELAHIEFNVLCSILLVYASDSILLVYASDSILLVYASDSAQIKKLPRGPPLTHFKTTFTGFEGGKGGPGVTSLFEPFEGKGRVYAIDSILGRQIGWAQDVSIG